MSMTRDRFVHYTTGCTSMDEQHWAMFKLMDKLVAQLKSSNYIFVEEQVANLVSEMSAHFIEEDAMMVDINYPYIDTHRKAHIEQMAQVRGIQSKVPLEGGRLNDAYITHLADMLVKHVDEYDIQLVNYATAKGLTLVPKPVIMPA